MAYAMLYNCLFVLPIGLQLHADGHVQDSATVHRRATGKLTHAVMGCMYDSIVLFLMIRCVFYDGVLSCCAVVYF